MRKGQVLVIVMMVLAIGLTVAMAISSRSVTEITISTTQDESSRALEAAQAGLEKYLGGVPPEGYTDLDSGGTEEIPEMNASYTIPDVSASGGTNSYLFPATLVAGDVATIDLPGQLADGTGGLIVCWCRKDSCTVEPKIEVTVFYKYGTKYYAKTKPFYGTGQSPTAPDGGSYNMFVESGGESACGLGLPNPQKFKYSVNIDFFKDDSPHDIQLSGSGGANTPLYFARIRMLGNEDTGVEVAAQLKPAGANFPPGMWKIVESIGTSGDTVQKIRAEVLRFDLPAVFDAAIYSGGSITK